MPYSESEREAMLADDYVVVRALPPNHGQPLYPAIQLLENGPVFTYDDGPPQLYPVTAIAVVDPIRNQRRPVVAFDRFRGVLVVTSQRIVFFCNDYDTGRSLGFRFGALGWAIVFLGWLVGRGRARQRSRGLALVGQIMHGQITEVTTGSESLIITSTSPLSPRPLVTQIDFRHHADLVSADAALSAAISEAEGRPSVRPFWLRAKP